MATATTKKSAAAASAGRASLRNELPLGALVAELLGGAMLAFAALMTQNNPILGALAVVVGILVFTEVSGAYLNPVVVAAAWATRQISWVKAVGYIVVQVLGAMLAYVVIAKFLDGGSSAYTLFTAPDQIENLKQAQAYGSGNGPQLPGEWKPIWGEFLGSIIFGLGIAAAILGRKVGFDRAFTIGGTLLIALMAALAGSYGVLNPAVATAISAFAQGGWWSFAAYAIAPMIGAALGAWLFKLIRQDASNSAKA